MKYLQSPQPRGYAMFQTVQTDVHGIDTDLNVVTYDNKGDRPWFVRG
jgi:hypothetical protein